MLLPTCCTSLSLWQAFEEDSGEAVLDTLDNRTALVAVSGLTVPPNDRLRGRVELGPTAEQTFWLIETDAPSSVPQPQVRGLGRAGATCRCTSQTNTAVAAEPPGCVGMRQQGEGGGRVGRRRVVYFGRQLGTSVWERGLAAGLALGKRGYLVRLVPLTRPPLPFLSSHTT